MSEAASATIPLTVDPIFAQGADPSTAGAGASSMLPPPPPLPPVMMEDGLEPHPKRRKVEMSRKTLIKKIRTMYAQNRELEITTEDILGLSLDKFSDEELNTVYENCMLQVDRVKNLKNMRLMLQAAGKVCETVMPLKDFSKRLYEDKDLAHDLIEVAGPIYRRLPSLSVGLALVNHYGESHADYARTYSSFSEVPESNDTAPESSV